MWDAQGRLRAFDWEGYEPRMQRLLRRRYGAVTPRNDRVPQALKTTLLAYFGGELNSLITIACATGGTPFQQAVWSALRDIPAGRTESYGALAARIGRPSAVRAVGLANGANPIGLVIPCHRVIGANGSLTGYGGGIARKQWLLQHEGAAFRREA
jgi:methylated-DNA-[protein]-cysteine S-methyltransferase